MMQRNGTLRYPREPERGVPFLNPLKRGHGASHQSLSRRNLCTRWMSGYPVLLCGCTEVNHQTKKIKSLRYSLYYAEACNEFARPISTSLRLWATQLFSKKWCSGGELLATLSVLTSPRLKPQTSHSKNTLPLIQLAGQLLTYFKKIGKGLARVPCA